MKPRFFLVVASIIIATPASSFAGSIRYSTANSPFPLPTESVAIEVVLNASGNIFSNASDLIAATDLVGFGNRTVTGLDATTNARGSMTSTLRSIDEKATVQSPAPNPPLTVAVEGSSSMNGFYDSSVRGGSGFQTLRGGARV